MIQKDKQTLLSALKTIISFVTTFLSENCTLELRGKDGGGIGWQDHFLPHKFLKRTFQRRANFTKQLL